MEINNPRFHRDHRLLSEDVIGATFDELEHPWLGAAKALSPGTYEHIASIMQAEFFADGYNRLASYVLRYPLLSQPLVEACLRIPSWMWVEGGVNRAVTRKAVIRYLPDSALQRTSKGGHEDFNRAIFYENLSQIRSMLLDGHLARNGIIDRSAVDLAFTKPELCPPSVRLRLLRILDFEAWVTAARATS